MISKTHRVGESLSCNLMALLSYQTAKVLGTSNLANALEREEYMNAILPMENEMIDFEEGEKITYFNCCLQIKEHQTNFFCLN